VAESTGIAWCDATFNPWVGCEKVSPGCAHCYAETLVTGRMARPGTWGADGTASAHVAVDWKKPLRWARLARDGKLPDGSDNPDGHRPRVFCASLADVFEERDELDEWRATSST
jgi:protein gp37